jgi:hypothetical protein
MHMVTACKVRPEDITRVVPVHIHTRITDRATSVDRLLLSALVGGGDGTMDTGTIGKTDSESNGVGQG